jgi:trans-aconitate methyltransferase
VFLGLLRLGLLPREGRLLDLGCGQGLLLSLIAAARKQHAAGRWPRDWPAPPQDLELEGMDSHAGRVATARRALGSSARVEHGDLRERAFAQPCAAIVLIDVLLYLGAGDGERVIRKAGAALEAGGLLLIREPDAAAAGLALRLTRCSSWFDAAMRGRFGGRLHYRSAAAWLADLASQGFAVEARPMGQGTPFANIVFVAKKLAA